MRHLLATLALATSSTLALAADPTPARTEPGQGTMYVYLTQEDGKQIKLPLFDDAAAPIPVARVGSDVIAVQDLSAVLESAHQQMTKETKAGRTDFAPVLERMIDAKLIVLEARDIGLDDLPESKKAVAEYRETALREGLQRHATAGVKADPAVADRIYRDLVREWKVRSVLFYKQDEAKAFTKAVSSGQSFDELTKRLVAEKKARGGPQAEFMPADKMLPEIAAVLAKLPKGELSAPTKVREGFAVMRLEDTRYPENAKARADAEAQALAEASKRALKTFYDALVKRYAKTDEKLLKKLDFQAKKPGLAALEKDTRVLSRIEGASPITVGELAALVKSQFYHGAENAIAEKKINRQKLLSFDALVSRRIVPLEAKKLGIDQTPGYHKAVADFTDRLLFSSLVDKAIAPGVQVTDDEVKRYYEEHKSDHTLPPFYKLESLSFGDVKTAQAALDKLRSGTDFKWLQQNADKQVAEAERTVKFAGTTFSAKSMPAELAKLLAGSKPGDFRLYPDEKGQHHVIHVLEVTPAEVEPLEQAKEGIRQRLAMERLSKGIHEYAEKLRAAHPVKIYLTKIGS